jgi:5'-3' exonuclease
MGKASTVLHIDGSPSIQKSRERRERREVVEKKIDALEKEVGEVGKKRLASLFSRTKQAYRVPPETIDEIASRLTDLGWQICHCPYQADSHIASLVKDAPEKDKIAIVTTDSDLLVYEGVTTVTMPVGKSRELTTFDKSAVLARLGLESDFELLLVAILTTNDYSKGLPWYGIVRNADAVKVLRPFINCISADAPPDVRVRTAIEEYLKTARRGGNKSVQDYNFAIDAFVSLDEQLDGDQHPASAMHERITALLRKLEKIKVQRRTHDRNGQRQRQSLPSKKKKKYEKWLRAR